LYGYPLPFTLLRWYVVVVFTLLRCLLLRFDCLRYVAVVPRLRCCLTFDSRCCTFVTRCCCCTLPCDVVYRLVVTYRLLRLLFDCRWWLFVVTLLLLLLLLYVPLLLFTLRLRLLLPVYVTPLFGCCFIYVVTVIVDLLRCYVAFVDLTFVVAVVTNVTQLITLLLLILRCTLPAFVTFRC